MIANVSNNNSLLSTRFDMSAVTRHLLRLFSSLVRLPVTYDWLSLKGGTGSRGTGNRGTGNQGVGECRGIYRRTGNIGGRGMSGNIGERERRGISRGIFKTGNIGESLKWGMSGDL